MSNKIRNIIGIFLFVAAMGIGVFAYGKNADAASTYKIRINKQQNVVTIYKLDENGKYKAYKAMVCSVGYGTPVGNHRLGEKIRWHELDGPVYGQYCTRITGHILFHSVWYYKMDPKTLSYTQFNRLGTTASHGCVRLCVMDSKWIYDNVPSGTPVEIYSSSNPGPLGKPDMFKLSGYSGWDPTDETNPNNPYNKKKPSIKLKSGYGKKISVVYGSQINVLSYVTAKNTIGSDITGKIKYTVKYKEKNEKTYRKVKDFSTKRAGLYAVTYKVTDQMGRKASLKVRFSVFMKVPMQSFTLNKKTKTLYLGGRAKKASFTLALSSVTPENTSIRKLTFSSLNEKVAKVDENGKVTAVGVGNTKICAKSTDGTGIKVYCKIYVRQYADGVTLAAANKTLNIGETTTVTVGVVPETATGKKTAVFEYSSSDLNVANVDETGKVTAVGAGTATITVTAKNYSADGSDMSAQVVITVNGSGDVATPGALGVN